MYFSLLEIDHISLQYFVLCVQYHTNVGFFKDTQTYLEILQFGLYLLDEFFVLANAVGLHAI